MNRDFKRRLICRPVPTGRGGLGGLEAMVEDTARKLEAPGEPKKHTGPPVIRRRNAPPGTPHSAGYTFPG